MASESWADAPMTAFDLETTSADPTDARIVQAAIVRVGARIPVERRTWLVNPGVPIPEEAAAIHGITTEHVIAEGENAPDAIAAIVAAVYAAWRRGDPLVIYNAPYDLTVLEHELVRHDMPSLTSRGIGPVICPLTLDRVLDTYRKGKRTLSDNVRTYQAQIEKSHDACDDAIAAARVAWRFAKDFPGIGALSLARLQKIQRLGHSQWAKHLQQYYRKNGDPSAKVSGEWPYLAHRSIFTVDASEATDAS